MLWWFVETTLIAGVLSGLAALLGRLRTMDPTARHLLWLVVLIKFVTPPVIHSPWAVPRPEINWPVSQLEPNEAPRASIGRSSTVRSGPSGGRILPVPAGLPTPVSGPVGDSAGSGGGCQPVQDARACHDQQAHGRGTRAAPRPWQAPLASEIDPASIRRWLMGCWGLATLILALVQAIADRPLLQTPG